MKVWQIGSVKIANIVELEIDGQLDGFIVEATSETLLKLDWLIPDHVSPTGSMRMNIQSLLIQTPDLKIVVDTCIGNGRERDPVTTFSHLSTNFIEKLKAAGFSPQTVDRVVCTHLHLDHVGWNTFSRDGEWVPTFPNARYLFGREEYDHAARRVAQLDKGDSRYALVTAVFGEAVRPVVEAGLVDLVDAFHEICPEVSLFPTPGHTPGHVSVLIRSDGQEAIITGDAIHHPCQLTHPEWITVADADQQQTIETRRHLLDRLSKDPKPLAIGTHWAGAGAGRIIADGEVYRLADDIDGNDGLGDEKSAARQPLSQPSSH